MFNILKSLYFFFILKSERTAYSREWDIEENMAFSEVLDPVPAFCDFVLVTMVKHTFCNINPQPG
jgi:hypothetical protein